MGHEFTRLLRGNGLWLDLDYRNFGWLSDVYMNTERIVAGCDGV